MKITKTQLKNLIKEELDATMEEGMLGDLGAKISAGIKDILMLPTGVMLGALLGYLQITAPRDDIDLVELSKDKRAMTSFGNLMASGGSYAGGENIGKQFAKDWTNPRMSRDEIMSKYFSSEEPGPFGQ
tara:strand:+ start:317 stop:703 length:387 start_codon:yes stop_codon:yes gene_type:complete